MVSQPSSDGADYVGAAVPMFRWMHDPEQRGAPRSSVPDPVATRLRALQVLPGFLRARIAMAWAAVDHDPSALHDLIAAGVRHARAERVRPEQLAGALELLLVPRADEARLDEARQTLRDRIIAAAVGRLSVRSRG